MVWADMTSNATESLVFIDDDCVRIPTVIPTH